MKKLTTLIAVLVIFGVGMFAAGCSESSDPVIENGPATVWESDRRLTRTQAVSETSINFARSIAADEAGRVHLVWRDEQDGGSSPLTASLKGF